MTRQDLDAAIITGRVLVISRDRAGRTRSEGTVANAAPEIRLNDFATTPLYNIKAVVQATNISPSTLRAWERRYNMCQPQRSDSGYRLYSDRDIAIIRWLKAQVDAGMSISQAVAWLQTLIDESPNGQTVALPDPTGRVQEAHRRVDDGIAEDGQPRSTYRTLPLCTAAFWRPCCFSTSMKRNRCLPAPLPSIQWNKSANISSCLRW